MSANDETKRPRVLVVDDIADNLELLERLLTPRGYDIVKATNGTEALDMVVTSPPDVILLDLVMPGMDGFEVCERIKQNPRTRYIPIIMITGVTENDANVRALEAGVEDFVIRPFSAVLLNARIQNALRAKALQDELLVYQRDLEERIRNRTAQLERIQQVTVFSLAKLSESRDPETGEHLYRMRSYAKAIASYLGARPENGDRLAEDFGDIIYLTSPLHDIGKVGIPDQILLKPAKLTKQEFDIMKWHTTIGGDTLQAAHEEAGPNDFLPVGRDIAYYHHEKWDGTGYPKGLKEHEIPLPARIVALADVYDALTSKRPYKEPFPPEKARAIITEGRGSHFDPDVVDAFIACEAEFLRIHDSYQDSGEPSHLQKIVDTLSQADSEA